MFIRRTDANREFDETVLKRVVRMMRNIAKVTYLLAQRSATGRDGRYDYLRSRVDRFENRRVNAVCVLDEAHTVASKDDVREEATVAAEPRRRFGRLERMTATTSVLRPLRPGSLPV